MRTTTIAVLLLAAGIAAGQDAGKQLVFGTLETRVLSTGSRKIRIMDPAGKILWSCKAANAHDCWMLPNGNILFADGQIKEIDPKTDKIVWQYKPAKTKGGGAYSCQRLPGGVTLVGENSTGRVLEVDKAGKIVFEMPVKPYRPGNHHNMRMVRKLANGNYLVCHSGALAAVRLPNGNTLVSHITRITEFDPKGKVVWTFSKTDLPDLAIGAMCGIHVLPSGNIAVGVYGAYKGGKGNGLFEITRQHKVVWRYSDPKADRQMMSVQVLDKQGKCLPGQTLR